MPNLQIRITHQRNERIFFFMGSANAPRRAQRSHQALFRARKGALTSVVSKVRNCSNKKFGVKFGEKCPIYKTELRINVPGDYFVSGLGQCTKAGATEPPSHFFVRERTRLLVLFPKSVTVQTKSLGGNLEKNAQSTKPNYASTCRAHIFFSGLGQCTKAGATEPPSHFFVRERTRLLVLAVSKVRNCSNKKFGGEFGEKCPIYKTELRINVPGDYFVSGLGQCTKAGATEPPSHFFVRERARLLVLFPRPVTFRTTNLGKFGEIAQSTKPNYASTCRAHILFNGLCHER